ncbi:multi-copy leucine-rich repeat protein, putative, partial [Bodo saltans]
MPPSNKVKQEILGYTKNKKTLHINRTCGIVVGMTPIYNGQLGNMRRCQNCFANSAARETTSALRKSLEETVTDWLMEERRRRRLKNVIVFAATSKDQEQLNSVQTYLHQPTRANPLFGQIPLKWSASVVDEVRHVLMRESVLGSNGRPSLLCNSGHTGTGKTTLLQQTTSLGVKELKAMVDEHVKSGEAQDKYSPFGFFVTFNTGVTPIDADNEYLGATKKFPILTAIALRMAYSVMEPPDVEHEDSKGYTAFAKEIAPYCDWTSDGNNFDCIVRAMRNVLEWEGPMFIAIDEFKLPFRVRTLQECIEGLGTVCKHLLDDAKPLFRKTLTVKHTVYESYIAVSVYDAVDTIRLSTSSQRRLIAQAMPNVSVRDVAQLVYVERQFSKLHQSYLDVLGNKREVIGRLRPHQLLFLLHVALSTGTPRVMNEYLVGHIDDTFSNHGIPINWFHPPDSLLDSMFWSRPDDGMEMEAFTEAECICAAKLVAGVVTSDIFDNRDSALQSFRVFALHPKLAKTCTVTDVASTLTGSGGGNRRNSTRVLVSPHFLRYVNLCWPPRSRSYIRFHVNNLAESLAYHAGLATALVWVGNILVDHGGRKVKDPSHLSSVCDQLIAWWTKITASGFEELTFDALCLHLSCALNGSENTTKSLYEVLQNVCSVADTINVNVPCGSLECIDIPNFPSGYFDAFAKKDTELDEGDAVCKKLAETLAAAESAPGAVNFNALKRTVHYLSNKSPRARNADPPSAGNTSHIRLQRALEKGHHFCFQPSNPNNQAEDGVVFLRNIGKERTWTVLVFQNKFWLRDALGRISVMAKWRDSMGHLPATIVDRDEVVHTLRYVRILVTANPVAKDFTPHDTQPNERNMDLGRANAAFVKFSATMF